jgi:hypothetical protein
MVEPSRVRINGELKNSIVNRCGAYPKIPSKCEPNEPPYDRAESPEDCKKGDVRYSTLGWVRSRSKHKERSQTEQEIQLNCQQVKDLGQTRDGAHLAMVVQSHLSRDSRLQPVGSNCQGLS